MDVDQQTFRFGIAPGGLPVLGHIGQLFVRPLKFLTALPAYGDLVEIKLGTRPALVLCHPELTREALRRADVFDKGGPLYERGREVIADGLGTCPHHAHVRQRRMAQPAFHRQRMAGYAAVMVDQTAAAIDEWYDGAVIDTRAAMLDITCRTVAATLFSSAVVTDPAEVIRDEMEPLLQGLLLEILLPAAIRKLPLFNRRFHRARQRIDQAVQDVVASYQRAGIDHGDLLSTLIAARDTDGSALDESELCGHISTFLMGGIETTAATLTWALYLLGTYPEVQRRVAAEVDTVLDGRPPSYDDLPALGFTGRVIIETLRLHPPGWFSTREVTTATTLAGHDLRPGDTVLFSPYLHHHQASYYPDPERFDPDRWLPERSDSSRSAYVPFGGGPRKCIGDVFAMTEATIALASIAQRWHLESLSQARPQRGVVQWPHRTTMRLHRRRVVPGLT
jgi:pentalenene oxygenase